MDLHVQVETRIICKHDPDRGGSGVSQGEPLVAWKSLSNQTCRAGARIGTVFVENNARK